MAQLRHLSFIRAYRFEGSSDPGGNAFSLHAVGRVFFLVIVFL